jgi:CheY-like chemotaxis protein
MKILTVDDRKGSAHIVNMMLRNEGHQIRVARDGRDAYLSYLLFTPDVVITGIEEAEIDGLELMNLIRMDNPEIGVIYTVTCTADREAAVSEMAIRPRVAILQKPFSKSELMKALSDMFPLETFYMGNCLACSTEKNLS